MIRFDDLPPEVVQAMCTPMHLILPPSPPSPTTAGAGALFVGSMAAVHDRELLRQNRISHLVQVLDVPWLPASEKDGLNCYRIDILDTSSADLKPHLEGVCNHIDRALRSGANVLVHCQQVCTHAPDSAILTCPDCCCWKGISRSPAIVIAFLIRNRGMSFDAAYALVRRQRACVKPNSGFVRALQEWDSQWRRPMATRRFTS